MATVQGICRNCGSLMMIDDRDETCECVFCNCVFPSSEAIDIFNNPDGREFPNEKFEPSSDGKRHFTTRVFSDESIEKAIKREEIAKSQRAESSAQKTNEFEVSPNDVKAPAKVVVSIVAGFTALVVATLAIAIPMDKTRKEIAAKIAERMPSIVEGVAEVDTDRDDSGVAKGYSVCGQTCQTVRIITDDEIGEEVATELFRNYCSARSEARGKNDNSGVVMILYSGSNIYRVSENNGNITVQSE